METMSSFELKFILKDVSYDVVFEEGEFDDAETKKILECIEVFSKEICIDKTYVECKDNRRSSTFMVETGWNALRDLIMDSSFGKYLSPAAQMSLVEAFSMMARCYMYECISSFTDKYTHIDINVKPDSIFDVIICKDTSSEWKDYCGPWQDWEFDDNGRPIPQKSK